MSDSSDDGVVYQCNKCPKGTQFHTKQEYAQHRKNMHPKEKTRKQRQEEEAEEEQAMLDSMRASPSATKRTRQRQSPRNVNQTLLDEDLENRPENDEGSSSVHSRGPKSKKIVKGKPGPKKKSKAVAPWMDEDYSKSRFSGG